LIVVYYDMTFWALFLWLLVRKLSCQAFILLSSVSADIKIQTGDCAHFLMKCSSMLHQDLRASVIQRTSYFLCNSIITFEFFFSFLGFVSLNALIVYFLVHRYAREDTHYLLHIYDLMKSMLLSAPLPDGNRGTLLVEVWPLWSTKILFYMLLFHQVH